MALTNLTNKLTALANSIRNKAGITGPLTLDGMKDAVDGISGGGGIEVPLRTITYEVGEGFNTVKLQYVTIENNSLITKITEAAANSTGSITLVSGTGCDIESTRVQNDWTGEDIYPSIQVTTGYYVGGNGTDRSMIYIPVMDLVDHLDIQKSGW